MGDPTDKDPQPDGSNTQKAKAMIAKANETLEAANETAKNAGSVLNTIKWAAIAFVTLIVFIILFKVYQLLAAPAKAVGGAVEGVSDAVKSSSEAVAEGTSSVINRLDIPTTDQRRLNTLAEEAFETLNSMDVSEPDGVRDRMFRATNLAGSENRVCAMSVDFGNGDLPVFAAADNEAHATAKALGSTDDRLMRLLIQAGEDDVAINAYWDEEASLWRMKWKSTTLKKAASDDIAQARVFDVLSTVPTDCDNQ